MSDAPSIHWLWKRFSELSTQELYDLIHLRQEVFILEQACRYYDLDFLDQSSWHLLGYQDQSLKAYLRVLPPGTKYSEIAIGRVVSAKDVRKRGIGRELMNIGLEKIESSFGSQDIRISAQSYLIRFYESLRFKIDGEEYLEDGIPHVEMVRRA